MNVFIGNGRIIAGNRIYCCWYDPEQKDGAEKMAYPHSCRYCSGSDQRIFIYLVLIWLLYGIQIREPETEPYFETDIAGDDWRTFRAYSEDLHLDDAGTLIFCLSPLDGKNGYAVYDSASGAREGSLLWEPGKRGR